MPDSTPVQSEKCYILVEFPYPSGSGLHIGHAFTFTGGDVYARYQRMRGRQVLFPIGWDAFGLPTENYAIRTGRKPQDVTRENTAFYQRQMRKMGFSFDWERLIDTTDPAYYRWTQWIFLQLYKHGLTYKQEMPINWCPRCKVGLANEEVIQGNCERCGAQTERRSISQWVVRITAYADRLLDGLEQTDFIEKVKAAQVHWIGRSPGARIRFQVTTRSEPLEVFTTRPDTLWGSTFLVIAPEHPLVESLPGDPAIRAYVEAARHKSDMERSELNREKTGVYSGLEAVHPASGAGLPIWIADFVTGSYGTGAIMAVPAHDARDHEFARQFDLPIRPVIQPEEGWDFTAAAYEGMDGRLAQSGPLDGLTPREAIPAALDWLAEQGSGESAVSYHLRDWIFSRQHYWGEPIPMIQCPADGWVPVPEDQLPVILPELEKYQPTDTGESPLANVAEWVNVTCPQCGGPARRETDTMPNWAGSDWYFLRYVDPQNTTALADMDLMRQWLPVDVYIGGDEHNTLHLLYSRFIYQFLYDIGAVPKEVPEPYMRRLSHGVLLGKDGQRMSKSRGNVLNPDEIVDQVGADVVRTYLMFIGPYEATMTWNDRAVAGVRRFLDRLESFVMNAHSRPGRSDPRALALVNRAGKSVGGDIGAFKFNTAVASLMETLNGLIDLGPLVTHDVVPDLVKCAAPFAPILAERCWQALGLKGDVHTARWPEYDPSLELDSPLTVAVQVNGKLRGTLSVSPDAGEAEVRAAAQSLESVARHLGGEIVKVIYVPGRTINFVVKPG